MNRENIIAMAREAGLADFGGWTEQNIERFAALVAAAEREKVAAWMMIQRSYATGHGDTTEDLLVELEWQVRESEREACAKVCDEIAKLPNDLMSDAPHIAAAIRSRGETK